MTLNQLIYFQKVATLENYHQAAEILYVSQPSLSRSMAALETELGITLFKKDGRGVVLTKAGHLFLEHANKIIADCDVAVDKMQELSSNGGEIDIGYVFPLASNMKRGTASVWCCSFFDTQVCNKSCRWQVLCIVVWEKRASVRFIL